MTVIGKGTYTDKGTAFEVTLSERADGKYHLRQKNLTSGQVFTQTTGDMEVVHGFLKQVERLMEWTKKPMMSRPKKWSPVTLAEWKREHDHVMVQSRPSRSGFAKKAPVLMQDVLERVLKNRGIPIRLGWIRADKIVFHFSDTSRYKLDDPENNLEAFKRDIVSGLFTKLEIHDFEYEDIGELHLKPPDSPDTNAIIKTFTKTLNMKAGGKPRAIITSFVQHHSNYLVSAKWESSLVDNNENFQAFTEKIPMITGYEPYFTILAVLGVDKTTIDTLKKDIDVKNKKYIHYNNKYDGIVAVYDKKIREVRQFRKKNGAVATREFKKILVERVKPTGSMSKDDKIKALKISLGYTPMTSKARAVSLNDPYATGAFVDASNMFMIGDKTAIKNALSNLFGRITPGKPVDVLAFSDVQYANGRALIKYGDHYYDLKYMLGILSSIGTGVTVTHVGGPAWFVDETGASVLLMHAIL